MNFFINEFHYDNDGADVGEFVEVAGPADADLDGFSLVLYNGSNGASYARIALQEALSTVSDGVRFITVDTVGMQNGGPDGMALVGPQGVVEFLSYEGAFTAADGPAKGMTSIDVGVAEGGGTPAGHSLQRTGDGSGASDFAWAGPQGETRGTVNEGQTITFDADAGTDGGTVLASQRSASIKLDGAEIVAYDAGTRRFFVTSDSGLQIVDGSDPFDDKPDDGVAGLTLVATIDPATLIDSATGQVFDSAAFTSVAVANGLVVAALPAADMTGDGSVLFFDAATGDYRGSVKVGPLPDSLAISANGAYVVVANEGQSSGKDNEPDAAVNPNGSVSIIAIDASDPAASTVSTYDFSDASITADALRALGARVNDNAPSVAADIEPEYVAIEGNRAVITLQENNAVAIIEDIATFSGFTIGDIQGLGFKNHSLPENALDPSDRDGAIDLRPANVNGIFMPDGVATYTVDGRTYMVLANEGDDRDVDAARVKDLALDARAFPNADALKADGALGRLIVSAIDGDRNGDGVYEALFSLGGRSFSIRDEDGDLVFDSGDMLDRIAAELGLYDDGRSDNKGVEPEAVEIGMIDGKAYAFVGLERADATFAFDISDPRAATYVGAFITEGDDAPEGLKFISASESGTASNLLVVANEGSNTLTVHDLGGSAGEEPRPQPGNTLISTIQGTADTQKDDGFGNAAGSPLRGKSVTVEAIVVGDFQNGDGDEGRNLRGFYIQEEDADADGDARSSEGLFVFEGTGSFLTDVAIGDKVRITGTVSEFFGETQLDVTNGGVVEIVSSNNPLPGAALVQLPSAATTRSQNGDVQPDLEAFEGMRVTIEETLTITEQFQLDRFNEIKLFDANGFEQAGPGGTTLTGGRPYQYTQHNDPDAEGNAAYLDRVGSRTITYDDGLNVQNAPITNLQGFGAYSAETAPRMGDTTTGLSGILDYKFAGNAASGATWRIRATEADDNSFDRANPRPAEMLSPSGNLKVAAFNVLNFFTTLDQFPDTGGDDVGPDRNLEPRGADIAPQGAVGGVGPTAEYDRQLEKLVEAIAGLDADIVSLIEIENDFLPGGRAPGDQSAQAPRPIAIEALVEALNARGDTYAFVDPGQEFVGGDAIAVGMIYRTDKAKIAEGTAPAILTDEQVDPSILDRSTVDNNGGAPGGSVFNGPSTNRSPLAVTFEELDADGGLLTVVANHFKSKGGSGQGADADLGDGAGNFNNMRLLAAEALDGWLKSDPTGSATKNIMLMGDFNAYASEDPIDYLTTEAGFVDVARALLNTAYSFVFDGLIGTLDYAFASMDLFKQIVSAIEWHINADEADALDYNLEFGRDPELFDATNPYRSSDHDPILVGLNVSSEDDMPNRDNQISAAEFLGSTTIPNGTLVDGLLLGGLSGITRLADGTYVAISDARDALPRFYSLDIDLGADGRLGDGDITVTGVTQLRAEDGAPVGPSDPEAIVSTRDDVFYISSEGSDAPPSIRKFSSDGVQIGALELPDFLTGATQGTGVSFNRGIESLALTPNGKSLFAGTEHPLRQDAGQGTDEGFPTRILEFDTVSGELARQFVYRIDGFGSDKMATDNGLVELATLDDTHLLAMERIFVSGKGNSIRIYEVDLSGATDLGGTASLSDADMTIVAAQKTLIANIGFLPDHVNADGIYLDTVSPDNLEGMVLGARLDDGRQTLLLVSDNNFRSDSRQITNFEALTLTIEDVHTPEMTGLGDAARFLTGKGAIVLDGDVDLFDIELDRANAGHGDYRGASLTIAREGGADASDLFGASGKLGDLVAGEALVYDGRSIGTVVGNGGGTLSLAFNGEASGKAVDAAVRAITYENSSVTPETSVSLQYSFNDGTRAVAATKQVEIAAQKPYTLELLHFSDQEALSGAIEAAPNLSAVLNALRAQDLGNDGLEDNTLTLSSGDLFIPGVFATASEALYGARGLASIQIQNELGVQASALGNHDFDFGPAALAALIDGSAGGTILGQDFAGTRFPYLSSNLDFSTQENLAPLEIPGGQAPQAGVVTSSTIIEVGGEKIGVVGATTPTNARITSTGSLEILPLEFDDTPTDAQLDALAAVIQAEVDRILEANPDMNKVILSSHMQRLSIEEALATRLSGVDIIIAGGSNTRLFDDDDRPRDGDGKQGQYPIFETGADGNTVAIVNTDGSYKYVGRLAIDFDADGHIIANSYDAAVSGAYATDAAGVAALNAGSLVDPEIARIASEIEQQVVKTEGNVFGVSDVFLNGNRSGQGTASDPDGVRTQATNLGNLTADANLAYANRAAQALGEDEPVLVSIKNGGGIRASIGETTVPAGATEAVRLPNGAIVDGAGNVVKPEGGISQNDIASALAFNNSLSLVTLTRAQLVEVLEYGVGGLPSAAGRFAQLSGIELSFDPALAPGSRIQNAAIVDANGEALFNLVVDGEIAGDPNQTFRVVTLGFLAGGGDGYPFPQGEGVNRVDLNDLDGDGQDDGLVSGEAVFANDGTEQDAFAEYLFANYSGDIDRDGDGVVDGNGRIYSDDDTGPLEDVRIQNLRFRGDEVSLVEASGANTGTADDDTLVGTDGDNRIEGLEGDDRIEGRGGDDALFGGDGDDILLGGAGADAIDGGAVDDMIRGGDGDDRLLGAAGNDLLFGDAGNDEIDGGDGDDRMDGGDGDDRLTGGAGRDEIRGGAGKDRIDVRDEVPTADFVDAGDGDDVVTGGPLDQLYGGAGDDRAIVDFSRGSTGTPVVILNNGAGTLKANDGTLIAGFETVDLTLTAGDDRISTGDVKAVIDAGDGNDVLITGSAADLVDGGLGDDRIAAGRGDDTVRGGAGNDLIFGNEGNDVLFGDAGNDRLFGGAGNDILTGGPGDDLIDGGAGDDIATFGGRAIDHAFARKDDGTITVGDLEGSGGTDGLTGVETLRFGEVDYLIGSKGSNGNDILFGTSGDDDQSGGRGDDILVGGDGDDRLLGGSGDDILFGDGGDDTLDGGSGNDVLFAGTGSNGLRGGSGDDRLVGGIGDDRFTGGSGDDRIELGGGSDVVDAGSGTDVVVLAGSAADYSGTRGFGRFELTSEGQSVELRSVERLVFDDREVDLTDGGAAFDSLFVPMGSGENGGTNGNGNGNGGNAFPWTFPGSDMFDASFEASADDLFAFASADFALNASNEGLLQQDPYDFNA
ncbi:ExeM/NucH family extracellular endonuclease [Fulvimarina sp. 2208YS6-2-32]|uniref:ExeM/NucH family extracellular endonuclease n=1 Tax=Fulvimarina uroteuthidis TaxID=3098149 RepID=A0ABU5I1L3_9HYPH|nr:ExeM/NucH family extracellular endonuclease [Fulvimarina sp. 2208YS6-2-32]MDY8109258.1 ExeM/NucH family extracellular endonuclease [Fulvimarina sp. 2208YS6-2-32]